MNGLDAGFFMNVPIAPPPPGKHSDFDSPAHDARALWILALLSTTVAFVAVVARLYVKRFVAGQKIFWDDGACILAMAAAIANTSIVLKQLDYGLGKHLWNIRVLSVTRAQLLSLVSSNVVLACNMLFVRVSVLAVYQRLFWMHKSSRRLIHIGYCISIIVALPDIAVGIARMVKCSTPLAGVTDSYCDTKNGSIGLVTFAVAGLITDIFIFSIALSRLRLLQVNKDKKIRLIIVFAMGLLTLFCSLGCVIFIAKQFSNRDIFWYSLWIAIFKCLEANIALTCACAPFLPALWKTGNPAPSSFKVNLPIALSDSASPRLSSGSTKYSEKGKLPTEPESPDLLVPLPSYELGMREILYPESVHVKHDTV